MSIVHADFKAKSIFYKALKKQPSAAAYGLSVIYSRNNNHYMHAAKNIGLLFINDPLNGPLLKARLRITSTMH